MVFLFCYIYIYCIHLCVFGLRSHTHTRTPNRDCKDTDILDIIYYPHQYTNEAGSICLGKGRCRRRFVYKDLIQITINRRCIKLNNWWVTVVFIVDGRGEESWINVRIRNGIETTFADVFAINHLY